jgi:anti-sigma B factor antagonist
MGIEVDKIGDVTVLRVSGRLTIGPETQALARRFREVVEESPRHLVLDLLGVPWLDSTGIGETVACYKRARDKKVRFAVAAKGKTYELLVFYALAKILELHETLEEALVSVKR